MNNIAATERAIADGTYQEVVYPVRVYALTNSEEHLVAGADWFLALSAKTREDAEKMLAPSIYAHVRSNGAALYQTLIVDTTNDE